MATKIRLLWLVFVVHGIFFHGAIIHIANSYTLTWQSVVHVRWSYPSLPILQTPRLWGVNDIEIRN